MMIFHQNTLLLKSAVSRRHPVVISAILLVLAMLFSIPLFATELTTEFTTELTKDNAKPNQSFDEWKQVFKQSALQMGINEGIFDAAFEQLKANKTVLKLDRNQPEFSQAIWTYIDNTTGKRRIQKGKEILKKHRQLFNKIVKKYQVPAEIIIAIWAMESDFGGNYGNMQVIRSLATLAHAGRRKAFASKELLAALYILQAEHLESEQLIGSWAGAIGHPQFMPSSFQKYAIDFNLDGKRDLWNSLDDAFASIANYLQAAGWQPNQAWGVEVMLPDDFNWKKQAEFNLNNESLMIREWMLWGIKPAVGDDFENLDQLAKLFFPAGHLGPAFLIFDNFSVIKKYNLSLSYTLSVGLLASGIATKTDHNDVLIAKWPRNDKPLSRDNKIWLQTQLNQQGFNVGEVDGKVGSKTRHAIRNWQLKHCLAADGYMPLRLFEKIEN